jgi:hypothetical protein
MKKSYKHLGPHQHPDYFSPTRNGEIFENAKHAFEIWSQIIEMNQHCGFSVFCHKTHDESYLLGVTSDPTSDPSTKNPTPIVTILHTTLTCEQVCDVYNFVIEGYDGADFFIYPDDEIFENNTFQITY